MNLSKGELVRSTKGHDKDTVYFIMRMEDDFLYLVDGKHKKVKAPKKKRWKHVISEGLWKHPVTECIQRDDLVLDSEIRKAIAIFRDKFSETKEV